MLVCRLKYKNQLFTHVWVCFCSGVICSDNYQTTSNYYHSQPHHSQVTPHSSLAYNLHRLPSAVKISSATCFQHRIPHNFIVATLSSTLHTLFLNRNSCSNEEIRCTGVPYLYLPMHILPSIIKKLI